MTVLKINLPHGLNLTIMSITLLGFLSSAWSIPPTEETDSKPRQSDTRKEKQNMSSIKIIGLSIVDHPEWNSSYERQINPPPEEHFSLTVENEEFSKLADRVVAESKINETYSIQDFFGKKIAIEKREEERRMAGYAPAYSKIIIEFSNGEKFRLGKYPFYSLSGPMNDLIKLTREKGAHPSFRPYSF